MTVQAKGQWLLEIPRSISREDMAALPIGEYEGDIRIVETERDLERALEEIAREKVVGFDTETRPSFKSSDRYLPCLAQVATTRAVYLIRLGPQYHRHLPAELLESVNTLKVGIGLADDIRALKLMHPFTEKNILDLGGIARLSGFEQTGLRNLAGLFLKIRIPKTIKTSNWESRKLTSAQIRYAATDAWVCRELYLRFQQFGMVAGVRSIQV